MNGISEKIHDACFLLQFSEELIKLRSSHFRYLPLFSYRSSLWLNWLTTSQSTTHEAIKSIIQTKNFKRK